MNYLITGAGSGIGKAIAIGLSNNNHNCYLMGRNNIALMETLNSLKNGEHKIFVADIAEEKQLETIITNNSNLILDGIIANAGIGGENNFGKEDRWRTIINTNLTGTYLTVQYFLPALQKSRNNYKQVIITSSVLARLGVSNYSAYCASKAGLLGLMRSWAIEYAPQNILVNAICPGWVNTNMAQQGLQGIADNIGITKDHFFDIAMQSVPLKKMSEPTEIAELVFYLLNQQSLTGQTIDINGGAIMNS